MGVDRPLAVVVALHYHVRMTVQIPIRIPDKDAEQLDAMVACGRYASRSDALRQGLNLILRAERNRQIEAEYRRAYAEHPQEESEIGLWAFAQFVEREEAGAEPL